jgi:hypothetical protein
MRRLPVILGLALLVAAAPADAQVRLTIQNGRVSLNAANATLRQILDEWARIGQTRIVNIERVVSAPLTLQLTDVAEEQALDVILRSVSGYVAAPRPIQNANASRFDRIVIMATSSPVRAATGRPPGPSFVQQQQPQRDEVEELLDAEPDGTDEPPSNLVMPAPRPVFGVPPPVPPPITTPTENPAGAPAAAPAGLTSVGVSVPGMIVAPPAQPGSTSPVTGAPGPFMPAQPAGQPPVGVFTPGVIIPAPAQPDSPGAESQAP